MSGVRLFTYQCANGPGLIDWEHIELMVMIALMVSNAVGIEDNKAHLNLGLRILHATNWGEPIACVSIVVRLDVVRTDKYAQICGIWRTRRLCASLVLGVMDWHERLGDLPGLRTLHVDHGKQPPDFPLVGNLTSVQSRLVAQVQGIFTQLIFDHMMHVRLHGAIAKEKKQPPSQGSTATASRDDDHIRAATNATSETLIDTAAGESDDANTLNEEALKPDESTTITLGKLNNLVSTDVTNLETGQYWILTGQSCALHSIIPCWLSLAKLSSHLYRLSSASSSFTLYSAGGRQ